MTDERVNNQELLFQYASSVENLKKQLKSVQAQLEEVMLKLGVDTYHQDPVNGVVYKIYEPEGTFISFKSIDVKRTALAGEKGGTVLSKSEAEANGFVINK